jgi:hypothetical protein
MKVPVPAAATTLVVYQYVYVNSENKLCYGEEFLMQTHYEARKLPTQIRSGFLRRVIEKKKLRVAMGIRRIHT